MAPPSRIVDSVREAMLAKGPEGNQVHGGK